MFRAVILLTGAVVVTVGAFTGLGALDVHAQGTKAQAPLELGEDAAARPWKRYANWPARDGSKFNTLAKLASPPPATAPRKLSAPIDGNAENGAKLVADRNRGGSCLACHGILKSSRTQRPALDELRTFQQTHRSRAANCPGDREVPRQGDIHQARRTNACSRRIDGRRFGTDLSHGAALAS